MYVPLVIVHLSWSLQMLLALITSLRIRQRKIIILNSIVMLIAFIIFVDCWSAVKGVWL